MKQSLCWCAAKVRELLFFPHHWHHTHLTCTFMHFSHVTTREIRAIATSKNTSCQNKSLKGTAGMQLHDNRVSFEPKRRGDSVVFSAVPQSWKSFSLTTSSVRLINVSNLSTGWILHIGMHTAQSFCIRMLRRYFLAVLWTCESKPAK